MSTLFANSRRAWWCKIAAVSPLVASPVLAMFLTAKLPAWWQMWSLAGAIYASLKWLTWCDAALVQQADMPRSYAYLLLWPGMDAQAFLTRSASSAPAAREWLAAFGKLLLGVFLFSYAAILLGDASVSPQAAAWIAVVGMVLWLHFGLFHLLSLWWRRQGIDARPLMDAPLLAASLGDFWGRRWNLAFRDLSHRYIFRPVCVRQGITAATLSVFLVSGLVHDVVITVPARGGYGGPTLYFLLQGLGVLLEHTRSGRRLGLGRGWRGRLFAAAVLVAPLPLLAPPPFIERVVAPMLAAVGATC